MKTIFFSRSLASASVATMLLLMVGLCAAAPQAKGGPVKPLQFPQIHPLPFSLNPNSSVTDLTSFADAQRLLRDDDKLYLAYFYDSLDINSVRLGTSVEEAAGLLKGFVDVVGIDAREPGMQWLLNAWGVQVIPSIRAVPPRRNGRASLGDGHPINGVGGIKQPVEFNGRDFTPESIKKFALSQLAVQPYIEKIDDKSLDQLLNALKQTHMTIVLLVTDKDATSQLYRSLATQYFQRAAFLEAFKGKSAKLVQHFGVKTFPHLVVFPNNGDGTAKEAQVYKGKLGIQELSDFVAKFTVTREAKEQQMRAAEQKAITLEMERAAQPVMQVRSIEHWMNLVLGAKSTVAVLFADPTNDEAKRHLGVLATVKKALTNPNGKSKAAVGSYYWIDGGSQPELAAFFSKGRYAESGSALVFISPKKSASTLFVGAFDVDGVSGFIKNSLGKGGSQYSNAELPNFVDETLQ